MLLYDSLRIVAAVAAILLIGVSPWVIGRGGTHWSMKARIVGSALVCVGLTAAYLSTLGDPPGDPWRLAIIATGVVVQAAGAGVYLMHLRHHPGGPTVRTVDVLDHLPATVIVADRESRILTVAGSASVTGWTATELKGRPLASIIPPRFVGKHLAGIDRLATTGEITVAGKLLPLYVLDRERNERPVTLTVIPLPGGRYLGVLLGRDG